jgi:indole-3-glycerol phosphate synthase
MIDVLARIVAQKEQEVAAAKQRQPLEHLQQRIANSDRPRNLFSALTRPKGELRVLAEIKKASPSAGVIREQFDPVALARAYHQGGAAAISCLTDETFFQGKLQYIAQIKEAVPLPILRKDFIIDPYQVYESRAAGADAILLIAECLEEHKLLDLLILATELQLSTLVEVHEVESLLRIRPHIGFPHPQYTLLGINNRDLKTMTVDINHTLRMLAMIEDPDIVVSESGIKTPDDVARLRQAGVHRILVGEHLMRQPDVAAALRELMG